MTRRNAVATALAAILATLPLSAVAVGTLTIELDAKPYSLAATCDLSQPLVFVNLQVGNVGNSPTVPRTITAADAGGVFRGQVSIPSILTSQMQMAVQVPLTHVASSSAPVGGAYTIVALSGAASASVVVSIPASLCASIVTPGGSPPPGGGLVVHGSYIGARNQHGVASLVLKLPAPSNVQSVRSAPDCGAHASTLGALFCPDMIKSGNLLLDWDYNVEGHDVDGFRIYRVDNGAKQLVDRTTGKETIRISDVKQPSGGYTGACYAVAAYAGKAESDLSHEYCVNSSAEVAKTVHLTATQLKSTSRGSEKGTLSSTSSSTQAEVYPKVGYYYSAEKNFLGDSRSAQFWRLGVRFDMSRLADHRIVAAKLRIAFDQANSCATDVGRGMNEWWFADTNWNDAFFGDGIGIGDAGPELAADVTPIVTHWIAFDENRGLVLKGNDENLGAFTNKSCTTYFPRDPADYVLDVTYY